MLTLAAVLVVIAAGLLYTANAPAAGGAPAPAGSGGALGLAMVFVLLTYGGWNEAAYLSAEVRDVGRNMVRVLVLGTLVLATLYILMALAYLHAFGLEGLRGSRRPPPT